MGTIKNLAMVFAPLVFVTGCALNDVNHEDVVPSAAPADDARKALQGLSTQIAKDFDIQTYASIAAKLALTCEYAYDKLGDEYDMISIRIGGAEDVYSCPGRAEIDKSQRDCANVGSDPYKKAYCSTLFEFKVN